jgi:hypothetical protein
MVQTTKIVPHGDSGRRTWQNDGEDKDLERHFCAKYVQVSKKEVVRLLRC